MAKDPRSAGPRPPFPRQKQTPPGETGALDPRPDHGEYSYQGSNRFSGCAAIITGADSGIGRAVALAFAREGADVLIAYLDEEKDARESAKWVAQAGRRAVLVAGDVSDEEHCEKIIDTAVKEFGRIDVLINNAGFQRTHENLQEFSADEVQHTFGTNIESMFYLCKAAASHMKPGSAIVNTASIQADDPSPQLLAYAATSELYHRRRVTGHWRPPDALRDGPWYPSTYDDQAHCVNGGKFRHSGTRDVDHHYGVDGWLVWVDICGSLSSRASEKHRWTVPHHEA